MMKDYKKVYLIMWTNYKKLSNSVDGQYFKASTYVIAVIIETGQLLQISFFANCYKKQVHDLPFFAALLQSTLHSLTSLTI